VGVLDGALDWVPVRRRLGIDAFGVNGYRAARAGDVIIEDHVESPGQQEAYMVVRGRARLTVGGHDLDLGPGEIAFVADPDQRRGGVALEDETALLAIGGWTDQPYHSLPWEPIYLTQQLMARGEWSEAAATLEREAGTHRDSAIVHFRMACCFAQAGEHERALVELGAALEARPGMAEMAVSDPLLEPLRARDDWPVG